MDCANRMKIIIGDKIIYLYIYLYSIAIAFLILPLNLISYSISNTHIQQPLIYGISVFCLVKRLPNRKPHYILLAIVLGITTLYLFTDFLVLVSIIFGAVVGYLLTKIKSIKYQVIGAIVALIIFFIVHKVIN